MQRHYRKQGAQVQVQVNGLPDQVRSLLKAVRPTIGQFSYAAGHVFGGRFQKFCGLGEGGGYLQEVCRLGMLIDCSLQEIDICRREVPSNAPGQPAPFVVILGAVCLTASHAWHLQPQVDMPQTCLGCSANALSALTTLHELELNAFQPLISGSMDWTCLGCSPDALSALTTIHQLTVDFSADACWQHAADLLP